MPVAGCRGRRLVEHRRGDAFVEQLRQPQTDVAPAVHVVARWLLVALDQFVAATLGLAGDRADLRPLVGGAGAGEFVEVTLQVRERRGGAAIETVEGLVDVDETVGATPQELRLKLAKLFVPGAHLGVRPRSSYHRDPSLHAPRAGTVSRPVVTAAKADRARPLIGPDTCPSGP